MNLRGRSLGSALSAAILLTGLPAGAEPGRREQTRLAAAGEPRPVDGASRAARVTSTAGAAVAQLVPYEPEGRTILGIRDLYRLGRADPTADGPRYLAAAASLDLAAEATLRGAPAVLASLARVRDLPSTDDTDALYDAIRAELQSVRPGVYASAARGLVQGVRLLRQGVDAPAGRALMLELIRTRAAAAHIASLFYVEAVRAAAGGLSARSASAPAIERLGALAADPCAAGCAGSPLAPLPVATRRAAAAIQLAFARTTEALAARQEDPFATLVRDRYEDARRELSNVVLPEPGGAPGGPVSRVLVAASATSTSLQLLPVVAIVDGQARSESEAIDAAHTVRHEARWGENVTADEPITEAARLLRARIDQRSAAGDGGGRGGPAVAPASVTCEADLPAHVLARVLRSLSAAGYEDVRLRRSEAEGGGEVRVGFAAPGHAPPDEHEDRTRLDVFGPFDYAAAERTLTSAAAQGRPAAVRIVLYPLVSTRALFRALDAVHVAWPDAEADVLLVLPRQVPPAAGAGGVRGRR